MIMVDPQMTEEEGGGGGRGGRGGAHLQISASGEHAGAVHGLDGVAVERGRGFRDDWRLGGG